MELTREPNKPLSAGKWLKRFGAGAFVFFFVKGLVWIGVFLAAWFGISKNV